MWQLKLKILDYNFNFGDVPGCRETLTFDHPKIKAKGPRSRSAFYSSLVLNPHKVPT